MIQSSLSETTRGCGNPNCACHRDPARRHGPHLYITWVESGRSRSLYVPAEQAERPRRAHAAGAQFWETAVVLAVQNREQFRSRRSKNRQGKFFINFSPVVSDQAVKAIRAEIRSWNLHSRSDKRIEDLSRMFNPKIRGWLQS
jgi:hypothetical protein